jgi:hypothetical protein
VALRPIAQADFTDGVVASYGPFQQPGSSLPLASNFIGMLRGVLQTCSGSAALASPAGGYTNWGPVLDLQQYNLNPGLVAQSGPVASTYMLQQVPSPQLATPTSLSATPASGGSLATGAWVFEIAATDMYGLTPASNPASATLTSGTQKVDLSWTESSSTPAGYVVLATDPSSNQYIFFLDGAATTATIDTPNLSVTATLGSEQPQAVVFRSLAAAYDSTTEIYTFPSSPIRFISFSGPAQIVEATVLGEPVTPNGGGHRSDVPVSRTVGPLPQIVEFNNHLILALGNTSVPYSWTGSGSPAALTNGFSLSFPAWVASTDYQEGSIITATVSSVAYLFQQIQPGVSTSGSGSAPTFPAGLGQQVKDNNAIWQNIGQAAVPAPRGAAHAISHAGYLWLWNTYPTNSSDGLDGPSVLKMSTLGNENSWNPLCTVPVGSGDGQQGMGMASFSVSEAGIAPQLTLVLFKEFSTYVLTGILPNASVVEAQTSLGCIAPRSIQFIPNYGIIRLTHEGIAIFDGISDQIVGDAVRPFLFPRPSPLSASPNLITPPSALSLALCHSFQMANPPMYGLVVAPNPNRASTELQFNRILLFDLENGAWWVIDLPFFVYAALQNKVGAYASTAASTFNLLGGIQDGIVRDFMDENTTLATEWDAGTGGTNLPTPISWTVYLPWLFGDGAVQRVYVRSVIVHGKVPSGQASMTATVNVSDVTSPNVSSRAARIYNFSSGDFQAKVDVGAVGSDFQLVISGTGIVQIESLEWMAAERAAGKPKSLMVG